MAQSSEILESVRVSRYSLQLKFKNYPMVSTLSSGNFTFESPDATPDVYAFKPVDIEDDYSSIPRVLTLYFEDLPPGPREEGYNLVISGYKDATGASYDETVSIPYEFVNDESATPSDDTDDEPDFIIEDKSIKTVNVLDPNAPGSTDGTGEDDFYIVESSPKDGELFVDSTTNDGAIIVSFSQKPNLTTLTPENVKVQKKAVNTTQHRWQDIPTKMALDANYPTLYVYLPSLDDEPTYYTSGREYFEPGHRYRIILSRSITS